MTQVKWQFAGKQVYTYDKTTFENTVTALVHRVKPKGFRMLNLDFTEKSESVYVLLVSLGSTEYLQFRISSHPTFGKRIYKTYNTNDFTGIVALEKHIENELKQAAGSKKNRLESKLTFHYQQDDFIFFRKLGYLHNIQKRFLMVETDLVRQEGGNRSKKALLVDEHNQVKGTLSDSGFANEVFAMLEKGFLTAHPISKEFSLIGTTRLYRNLSQHFGIKFMGSANAVDMKTYFKARLLTTDLPLRGTELWPLQNSYFLGNTVSEIKGYLQKGTAEVAEFLVSDKKIEAILLKDGHYLSLKITPEMTENFKDMLHFKEDLGRRIHCLSNYESFTFEQYLIAKLLRKLEASGKNLLVPKPLPHQMKILGSAPGMISQNLLKNENDGLIALVDREDRYQEARLTAVGKQLFEMTAGQFEPRFLDGLEEGNLPEDFVRLYQFNPYELVVQQTGKALRYFSFFPWLERFKTQRPNLVAYLASSPKAWDPADLPAIHRMLNQRLQGIVPEELALTRLELNPSRTAIEVGLIHHGRPLDFLHFTVSNNQYPTMMKLFRTDKWPNMEELLEEIGGYLARAVAEQGHYRHFKFSDYETFSWFHNLQRVGKVLKVNFQPDDFHLTKTFNCDLLFERDHSFLLRMDNEKLLVQLRYGILNGLVKLLPLGGDSYLVAPTVTAHLLNDAFVGKKETLEDAFSWENAWERFKLLLKKI